MNRSHWGGFVVAAGRRSVYHAGDSAWFDGFEEIGRRFPGLDAALLPVGAYEPAWFMERNHLNPEQAGRAFLATGARRFVPMHWGTVRLTDEELSAPIERVRSWWSREGPRDGRSLEVLAVGETLELGGERE
jgi:L-ascorbate metabolism protein UlaG (beta-lactamase superfamily)